MRSGDQPGETTATAAAVYNPLAGDSGRRTRPAAVADGSQATGDPPPAPPGAQHLRGRSPRPGPTGLAGKGPGALQGPQPPALQPNANPQPALPRPGGWGQLRAGGKAPPRLVLLYLPRDLAEGAAPAPLRERGRWCLNPPRERPAAAAPLRRGGARHVVLAGPWAAV